MEDKQLQREYQRFRQSGLGSYGAEGVQMRRATTVRRLFPQRIDFARKAAVVGGLELSDLAAYPVARAVINQNWTNPATQVVLRKLSALIQFP